jgi:hypothetical protein
VGKKKLWKGITINDKIILRGVIMREIELNVGTAAKIKNSFDNSIKIGHAKNGYYIIHNSKKNGPYLKAFVDFSKKEEIFLIGCSIEKSEIFRIDINGLTLVDTIITPFDELQQLAKALNKIVKSNNSEHFKDFSLMGKVGHYSIYMDENQNFFAVDNLVPAKPVDEYPKFKDYLTLINYYKENYGISLYNQELSANINRYKKVFFNFTDYITYIEMLNTDELPEELLLQIAAGNNIFRSLFPLITSNASKTSYTDKESDRLISLGYIEMQYKNFDFFKNTYPKKMKELESLITEKASKLKSSAINSLRNKKLAQFSTLAGHIKSLKITDLNNYTRNEIGAKRTLGALIFNHILKAAAKKANIGIEEGDIVKYIKHIFPEEYDTLWAAAESKMPDLYNQYLDYQKEKFDEMLKRKKG